MLTQRAAAGFNDDSDGPFHRVWVERHGRVVQPWLHVDADGEHDSISPAKARPGERD